MSRMTNLPFLAPSRWVPLLVSALALILLSAPVASGALPVEASAVPQGEVVQAAASPLAADPRASNRISLVAAEETETSWFRLDAPGSQGDPERVPLGLARWISGPLGAGTGQEGRRVELEVRWMGQNVRLLISERILPTEHRVIWREQLPRGGRTVLISVDRDDPGALLNVTETADGKVRRRTLPRDGGAWQLLSLVEAAAQGVEPHGTARILMPQRAEIERVGLELQDHGQGRRELALTFVQGLAGPRFTFEGRELVAFVWQAGGPVATRIPEQEHARWIRFGAANGVAGY